MKHCKRFTLILLLILVLAASAGCRADEDAATVPPAVISISRFQQKYETISWTKYGIYHEKQIDPQILLDNPKLQKMVKRNTAALPLDTDETINTHAWKILPVLIECGYLPEDWVPILALHFTNGVWIISYTQERADYSGMRDGTIDVFVAEDSGQIIFIYD